MVVFIIPYFLGGWGFGIGGKRYPWIPMTFFFSQDFVCFLKGIQNMSCFFPQGKNQQMLTSVLSFSCFESLKL